jgi:hypothetical protein
MMKKKISNPSSIPTYLSDMSWEERKDETIRQTSDWLDGAFAKANAMYVEATAAATDEKARLHVVFNIGADALRSFVLTDDYKNVYEHPLVEGKELRPSEKRKRVDQIVGLVKPKDFYFCALSIGGTGMRFYGEYCAVIRSPDDARSVKRVLDRNSYDFVIPPLSEIFGKLNVAEQQALAGKLMCDFRSPDFQYMLAVKVLQHYGGRPRLLTIGAVGEGILSDEDYVEAYHEGKIKLETILEVRSHPEDEMTESNIESRFERGEAVTTEELQWVARRRQVRSAMNEKNIRHRVLTGNGGGRRWR